MNSPINVMDLEMLSAGNHTSEKRILRGETIKMMNVGRPSGTSHG